jgi:hypothetical protein
MLKLSKDPGCADGGDRDLVCRHREWPQSGVFVNETVRKPVCELLASGLRWPTATGGVLRQTLAEPNRPT